MRKVRLSVYTQECGRDSTHRIAVWFEREEARPSGYYRDDDSIGLTHLKLLNLAEKWTVLLELNS